MHPKASTCWDKLWLRKGQPAPAHGEEEGWAAFPTPRTQRSTVGLLMEKGSTHSWVTA